MDLEDINECAKAAIADFEEDMKDPELRASYERTKGKYNDFCPHDLNKPEEEDRCVMMIPRD